MRPEAPPEHADGEDELEHRRHDGKDAEEQQARDPPRPAPKGHGDLARGVVRVPARVHGVGLAEDGDAERPLAPLRHARKTQTPQLARRGHAQPSETVARDGPRRRGGAVAAVAERVDRALQREGHADVERLLRDEEREGEREEQLLRRRRGDEAARVREDLAERRARRRRRGRARGAGGGAVRLRRGGVVRLRLGRRAGHVARAAELRRARDAARRLDGIGDGDEREQQASTPLHRHCMRWLDAPTMPSAGQHRSHRVRSTLLLFLCLGSLCVHAPGDLDGAIVEYCAVASEGAEDSAGHAQRLREERREAARQKTRK